MKVKGVILRSGLRGDGFYFTKQAVRDLAEREGYEIQEADDGELEVFAEMELIAVPPDFRETISMTCLIERSEEGARAR